MDSDIQILLKPNNNITEHAIMQMILKFLLFFIFSQAASAALLDSDVPQTLKQWKPWVLYEHKQQACPFYYNSEQTRRCQWPARLQLTLHANGAEFSQQWQVFHEGWVALPGDRKNWPQAVKLNNQIILINARNNIPHIWLLPGFHEIEGKFSWQHFPESLQIPATTGILSLTEDGNIITPDRDRDGRLWLKRNQSLATRPIDGGNRIEVKVFRRINDTIPLTMTTKLDLQIAGQDREIIFPAALTKQFTAQALTSKLPVRIEANGDLRVQVRPGEWTIQLTARHSGPLTSISLPQNKAPWPSQEVWVFVAENDLRLVEIQGAVKIDPQQTMLPSHWKTYPAYLMTPESSMQLLEKRRGDPTPAPNQLHLTRDWYLDFDGQGFTMHDQISGNMTQTWRLEMPAPAELGRVTLNGKEQLITQLAGSKHAGVEMRHANVNLVADSRVPRTSNLSAIGWDHDFYNVKGNLHLPPGWRLIDAAGIDAITSGWLQKWTLLDIFILLLITLSIGKLWHWSWGGVAFVTLILIYQEVGAPVFEWLNLLAAIALVRVVPKGRLLRTLTTYRWLSFFVVLVVALPFMIGQARQALYPQMEKPWLALADQTRNHSPAPMGGAGMFDMTEPGSYPESDEVQMQEKMQMQVQQNMAVQLQKHSKQRKSSIQSMPNQMQSYASIKMPKRLKKITQQIDVNAQVQTGPGLPQWQWNTIQLRWSGPVEKQHMISFYLLSPTVNRILGFLRVVLVFLLLLRLLDIKTTHLDRFFKGARGAMPMLAILIGCFSLVVPPVEADIPSQEMLDTYQQRLLEPAKCLPQCADLARLAVNVDAAKLQLDLNIHSHALIAAPLPQISKDWQPNQLLLNETPAKGLFRDANGKLWITLEPGHHHILISGAVPSTSNTITLDLPMAPRQLTTQLEGWKSRGIDDNGQAEASIQLQRITNVSVKPAMTTLQAETLPPFVQVQRTLHLDLDWEVETRIMRLTTANQPLVVRIPLLPGESIISESIQVKDEHALVNMHAKQTSMTWHSVLAKTEKLKLTAANNNNWIEVWRLQPSPYWHAEFTGIPMIHRQSRGRWLPEWRPWPGETIELNFTRPKGVPGKTLTIDKSQLQITPGQRASDFQLTMDLRSSRGGQHVITLPPEASLQTLNINGKTQSVRQEKQKVTVAITPGKQTIVLNWRQALGVTWNFHTPAIDLGVTSVNAQTKINFPQDRWILLLGGPGIGPAVLFWGTLVVVLLVALALGRIPWTPLRSHHWLLLSLGMAASTLGAALPVVLWLLALGWRTRLDIYKMKRWLFNLLQIGLVLLTLVAMESLFVAIEQGLLGKPDMSIAGNGSSSLLLRWYQDHAQQILPQPWVISVSLIWYRVFMLVWALWLAFSLLHWLRWGWLCFSKNGLWRKLDKLTLKKKDVEKTPQPS